MSGENGSGQLEGAVALVTGAASGIGRECAIAFAREGGSVTLADLNEDALAGTAAEIEREGGSAIVAPCDVRSEADVEAAVARTESEHGPITTLLTSAGIVTLERTHECDLDTWQRILDVNLTGTFLAAKHCLISMLEAGKGGAIVTIGSTSSVAASNLQVGPAYKASKGGVLLLTKIIAGQYGKDNIRANCLCPGTIDTGIIQASGSDENYEHFEQFGAATPLGRVGSPPEIASVATFLASSASSYMTGVAVMVDGGYTAI